MIKVYALPCAGGTSSMYFNMAKNNTDEVHIVPIELAGRGQRFSESLYHDFSDMVKDIFHIISNKITDEDYALFGHSMGGYLIYELCCMLKSNHFKMPKHLFLASVSPPNFRSKFKKVGGELNDEELLSFVIDIGGIPPEVAANKDFENIFFPIIKSDFQNLNKYKPTALTRLHINITTLYGSKDYLVLEHISEWKQYTLNKFEGIKFEGNHFFINHNPKQIYKIIEERV